MGMCYLQCLKVTLPNGMQEEHGPLAAAELQRTIERRAAVMAGGDRELRVPAQRVVDFLAGRVSDTLPPSSYRLGTVSAPLHELYPPVFTAALRQGLRAFDKKVSGFAAEEAVLHAAETRTSSPLTVLRDMACESTTIGGLFPCGEGAGYAGGIVSAAVDGLRVAAAILAPSAARRAGEGQHEARVMLDQY
jgi:uncharacterized protein